MSIDANNASLTNALSRRGFLTGLGAVASATALSPLLAACGSSSSSSSSNSKAPKSLGKAPARMTMLYAGDQSAGAAVAAVLPALKDALGIELQVTNLPYDQLQTKTFAELATRAPAHDIYVIDTPWTPTLTHVLEPLDSYIGSAAMNKHSEINIEDFVPKGFYDTSVYNVKNPSLTFGDTRSIDMGAIAKGGFNVLGLPIQGNALTMAYRKDLFDSPTEKAAFKQKYGRELAVPSTWDDFTDVASFFTRPGEKLYGTTLLAGVGDWSIDDFKTFAGSYGADGHLIDGHMKIQITSSEAVAALQYYVDLINKYKVTPPGTTSASWDNATSSFASGLTAMTMNYSPQALNSNVKGEVAYALVPKKTTYAPHEGQWQLSIPKQRDENTKAWAYQVIAWLTSAKEQTAMLSNQLHATRTSVYQAATKESALTEKFANFYDILGQSINNGVGRARVKRYNEVVQPIAVGVNDAARQAASPHDAMQTAAQKVQKTLASLGIKSTIA
jgi:multiple sugar transport system substrate-binding protein